jgi:hypothetical protein
MIFRPDMLEIVDEPEMPIVGPNLAPDTVKPDGKVTFIVLTECVTPTVNRTV